MCRMLNSSKKITSTLALIIIPAIIFPSSGLMIYLFATGQIRDALSVFSALIGIAGMVVGYFGSKASDKATSVMVKTHNKIIDSKEKEIIELREINLRGRNIPNRVLEMNELENIV